MVTGRMVTDRIEVRSRHLLPETSALVPGMLGVA